MTEIHSYLEALMLTDESPLRLAPGQVLFAEGQAADGRMYVVRSGSVELRSGHRVLETLGPGGVLGEMALIDPAPRSATAVAGADCSLTAVDERLFHKLVRQVPNLALEIMRVMARRLRRVTAELDGQRQAKAAKRPAPRRRAAKPKAPVKAKRGGRP